MTITESISFDDIRYINTQLAKFNAAQNGSTVIPAIVDVPGRTALAIRDESGSIIAGLIYRLIDNGETAYVDILWVSEKLRGKGAGKSLLDCMKKRGAELNCRRIQLYTVAYQAPEFYKKMGFVLTGTSPWENTTRFDYEFSLV